MERKKILIFGGCGFIGSNIATFLQTSKIKTCVDVFDNLSRKGSELNALRLKKLGIENVKGDIRSSEDLKNLKNYDYIIDASAETSATVGLSGSPFYILENNLLSTINCLEVARKMAAKFIFLSTSRVYPIKLLDGCRFKEEETRYVIQNSQFTKGISEKGVNEDFSLLGPRTMYGTSKLSSELIIQEYGEYFNLDYIINRFGAIAGPWQFGKQDQGFISHWLMSHIFGTELSYFGYGGQGKQVRDILHVNDLVRLIVDQIENFNLYKMDTYNAGGGLENTISLKELTGLCQSISGNKIQIESDKDREGDIRIFITDNSRVNSINGWSPKKDINDIIYDVYHWIKNNQNNLKSLYNYQ